MLYYIYYSAFYCIIIRWALEYNCTTSGACPTEQDTEGRLRTVVFSALFTHGSYPSAAPLWFFQKNGQAIFTSVDGAYIGAFADSGALDAHGSVDL